MVAIHTHSPEGSRGFPDLEHEWIHVYPGAPVPPVQGGSFNHLIWDILQRHKSHLFVGRYYQESFEKAKQHDAVVMQVEIGKRHRRLEQLKRRLFEITHPGGDWVDVTSRTIVEAASRCIEQTQCSQLLVWGSNRLVRLLRYRFPKHTIAFAQRWYEIAHASAQDLNYADILLLLSEGIARHTYRRYADLYPVTLILPNGVELDMFHPVSTERKSTLRSALGVVEDEVIAVVPSSIHGKKGANYLYHWISHCHQHIPGLRFLVVGQPKGNTGRGYKARLIERLDDMPNVTWIREVPRTQMPLYYQLSDFALMPSIYREGMSMAALESLASGLPVIATQRGIFPEIVQHGVTGILCPPESLHVDGLEALKTLVNNRALRIEMSANARRYAERCLSRERCLANFDAFFRGDWAAIDYDLSPDISDQAQAKLATSRALEAEQVPVAARRSVSAQ
ncbi:MAG: glycosyltransferase family 4 protein [Anaerolineales bacterium]